MAKHLVPIHSSIDLGVASLIIDKALELRIQHELLPLAVAIVDSGGNLVAFKRENGCGNLRHQIALAKAWSALGMGMSTRQIRDRLADRPNFQAALAVASDGRFILHQVAFLFLIRKEPQLVLWVLVVTHLTKMSFVQLRQFDIPDLKVIHQILLVTGSATNYKVLHSRIIY